MKAEILSLSTILLNRNTVFEPRLKSLKKGYIYYSMNKNPGEYYY